MSTDPDRAAVDAREPTIRLQCDACGNSADVPRQNYDPPNAVLCKTNECNRCNAAIGGFGESWYFDAAGNEILDDPAPGFAQAIAAAADSLPTAAQYPDPDVGAVRPMRGEPVSAMGERTVREVELNALRCRVEELEQQLAAAQTLLTRERIAVHTIAGLEADNEEPGTEPAAGATAE